MHPGETHQIRLLLRAFLTGDHTVHLRLQQDHRYRDDSTEVRQYRVRLTDAAAVTITDDAAEQPTDIADLRIIFVPPAATRPIAVASLIVRAPVTATAATPFHIESAGRGDLWVEPARGILEPGTAATLLVLAQGTAEIEQFTVHVGATRRTVTLHDLAPQLAAAVARLAIVSGRSADQLFKRCEVRPRATATGVIGQCYLPVDERFEAFIFVTDPAFPAPDAVAWRGQAKDDPPVDFRLTGPELLVREGHGSWRASQGRVHFVDHCVVLLTPRTETHGGLRVLSTER